MSTAVCAHKYSKKFHNQRDTVTSAINKQVQWDFNHSSKPRTSSSSTFMAFMSYSVAKLRKSFQLSLAHAAWRRVDVCGGILPLTRNSKVCDVTSILTQFIVPSALKAFCGFFLTHEKLSEHCNVNRNLLCFILFRSHCCHRVYTSSGK